MGLQNIELLETAESAGSFVNAAFVRRVVQEQWLALPKRYSSRGYASASGSIHLTSYELVFLSDGRVVLKIRGYDERPWPDVSFTITYTDRIGVSSFAMVCSTDEPTVDKDVSWVNYVTTGLAALLTIAFWPSFFLFEDILDAAIHGGGGPPRRGGPGCAIVNGFYPDAVPIPGGQKLDLLYTRAVVTRGGIFGSGVYLPTARSPEVSIAGPRQLSADFREGIVRANYVMRASDLRGELQIDWAGEGQPMPPNATATTFEFTVSGTVGTTHTRQISVDVRDEDGLTAGASVEVRIKLVDQLDEDIPPICRAKPWLCEDNPRP